MNSKPLIELISDDISETIIKVELNGLRISEFNTDGIVYQSLSIGTEPLTAAAGLPDIPYIAKILAVPDRGSISVEIVSAGEVKTISGINLPPARESWIEGEDETKYSVNEAVYNSEQLYPAKLASVEEPGIFRDFRITRVSIFPIRYRPARHQ